MKTLPVLILSFLAVLPLHGQDHAKDTTHAQQMAWWQKQRFGMFIHWGPVALRGKEISWSRGNQIPTAEYDALYKQFNPAGFNGGEWVRIAQRAGMKYMVFVAKHHDGFCEFQTSLTDYNIMSPQSPFRRDVTRELVDSAHQLGMGIGLYYSPTDWYVGNNGSPAYLAQYTNQVVDELLGHYGRIETIWWDLDPIGANPAALLSRMRQKQPWILVNNRGDHKTLGDYDTPEQRIGAFDTLHAWESCMTIDGTNQWAWNPNGGVKPLRQLIDMIVGTADGGGNCLLNVGPRPDGIIDPPMVARLREIGDWMAKYGESIYGTVGGPLVGGSWGGATHRRDTVYLHLKPFAGTVTLPGMNATIVATTSLGGSAPTVVQSPMSIRISLPAQDIDPMYTVLKMVLDPKRPVMHYRNVALAGAATQISTAYGGGPEKAIDGNIEGNFNANSVTHTDSVSGAWWSVDLGAAFPISYISIHNRTDGLTNRLADYNVILSDADHNPIWTSHQTSAPNPVANIDAGGRTARHVKIQLTGSGYLSLAEVQVLMDTLTTGTRSPRGSRTRSARALPQGKPAAPVFRHGLPPRTFEVTGEAVRP